MSLCRFYMDTNPWNVEKRGYQTNRFITIWSVTKYKFVSYCSQNASSPRLLPNYTNKGGSPLYVICCFAFIFQQYQVLLVLSRLIVDLCSYLIINWRFRSVWGCSIYNIKVRSLRKHTVSIPRCSRHLLS